MPPCRWRRRAPCTAWTRQCRGPGPSTPGPGPASGTGRVSVVAAVVRIRPRRGLVPARACPDCRHGWSVPRSLNALGSARHTYARKCHPLPKQAPEDCTRDASCSTSRGRQAMRMGGFHKKEKTYARPSPAQPSGGAVMIRTQHRRIESQKRSIDAHRIRGGTH